MSSITLKRLIDILDRTAISNDCVTIALIEAATQVEIEEIKQRDNEDLKHLAKKYAELDAKYSELRNEVNRLKMS